MRALPRSGFTLLEATMSCAIFALVGYALTNAVVLSNNSQAGVERATAANRTLRRGSAMLIDELRRTADEQLDVVTLPDGNHQVTFMLPIEVEGAATWGVEDRSLGATPDLQSRADWKLRYTVVPAPGADGQLTPSLVRQVLDEEDVVQRQEVVVQGLCQGTADPPGFHVSPAGDMWEVRWSTTADSPHEPDREVAFHVQARN